MIQLKNNQQHKNLLLIIFIIIFLFVFKIVYIYDGSILKPAHNLKMARYHNALFSGNCESIKDSKKLPLFVIRMTGCDKFVLNKDYLVGNEKLSSFGPISFINISKNQIRPIAIYTTLRFDMASPEKASEELDVLRIINVYKESIFSEAREKYYLNSDSYAPDFKIIGKKTTTTNEWVIGFTEKGGVQETTSLSLKEAPLDGYLKEIKLEPKKTYVARLRDGEHYMLLKMWGIHDNYEALNSSPDLYLYISPVEGNRLNFDLENSSFYYGTKEAGTYGEQYYNFKPLKNSD